ncbi:PEP-CTERM sorting domain-containing protein [Accumulibacter sp.]|uniref:PEP-CTERM sorting domain-containing protein n=1 Tax=Accumulibacter sp. TaxID=2053492 RepID=UPI002C51EB9F|nr:PEP-CTERM sorting domain-containing protein [Accumulibacter sp.]HNG16461.1 PEP-CTERM sorting domain-containing protein [Accumulibacter sp.]HNM63924.1 PEP-CTERM sorting domain-containing protein [Accumulibacter sp.]
MKKKIVAVSLALLSTSAAQAALLTDPDDARSWQGASVGTFAGLYYGSNTLANRQAVIANNLLDDSNFDATGYAAATLKKFNGVDVVANPLFGAYGTSFDQPGVSDGNDSTYNYTFGSAGAAVGGNAIDQHWIQTDNTIGNSVWDLGFQASKAAVFNSIDHTPLPLEAIESTVYLSNDMITWTQAVTERVWLEGIYSDTSVLWDGFVYAVGTGTADTFRYASIVWGGPGALQADGDNEINGVMGLRDNFQPGPSLPEPASLALFGLGLLGLYAARRRSAV